MSNTVYIAVGTPGAGKTTGLDLVFAGQHCVTIVNLDAIRRELSGSTLDQSFNGPAWDVAYARVSSALSAGQDVVIDATGAGRTRREELIWFCRQAGAIRVEAIWFHTSLATCLARNARRGNDAVPEYAVRRIHRSLSAEPPITQEGFDLITCIP